MNTSEGCELSRDVFSQAPLGPNKGSDNVAKCGVISTCPYGHGRGHTGEYPDKESSNVVQCGVISTCPNGHGRDHTDEEDQCSPFFSSVIYFNRELRSEF